MNFITFHELKMTLWIYRALGPLDCRDPLPSEWHFVTKYPLMIFHKAQMSYFHKLFSVFVSKILFWDLPASTLTHSLLFSPWLSKWWILWGPRRAQPSRFPLDSTMFIWFKQIVTSGQPAVPSSPQSAPEELLVVNTCIDFRHVHGCIPRWLMGLNGEVKVHMELVK